VIENMSPLALPEDRDGFRFRGGHVALDLTATLVGRLKAVRRDLIGTTDELAAWLLSSGLAQDAVRVRDADVVTAQALREAIYGLAMGGGGPAERDTLNVIAASKSAAPSLGEDGAVRLIGDARQLLTTIAREAIFLLGTSDATHVRQCEGEGCAVLFLDNSRKGVRRWCSMRSCGNKAKVAEFRRRKRADPEQGPP
jgi:predicted RNA-binding Zn ribbon-like protein